jgi:hypothetical protein
MRTTRLVPDASVLIESLRDIGYSLDTALADIIDNSITAESSRIDVIATDIDGQYRIAIIDNGNGMTESELLNAMRPGSTSPLHERVRNDLGRFGLGLKTASFSQCRRLTVVSRKNGDLSGAVWDLDLVARTNDWIVEIPERPEDILWADRIGETGTLVLWEKLDRVVETNTSEQESQRFDRYLDEASQHLEMVFHRFLDGEARATKLQITLNGRKLEPFDPFNSSNLATLREPQQPEKIKVGDHWVEFQAFTLPHHSKVSKDEWEKYAGRAGYLKNQGFYVYREKRLIIYGTWFGLAKQSELTRLSRVRIDLPNSLDHLWKIDVKKSHAQLPPQVRERMRKLIDRIAGSSKRTYTSRGARLTSENKLPVWIRTQNKGQISYQINPDHPVFTETLNSVSAETANTLRSALKFVSLAFPIDSIVADVHGAQESLKNTEMTGDEFEAMVKTSATRLRSQGIADEMIAAMLRNSSPFSDNWEVVRLILGHVLNLEIVDV